MTTYVADCETNGFLADLTVIHSLCFINADTGEAHSHCDQPGYPSIEDGLRILMEAECTVWHNGQLFDIPALQKIYPWFHPKGRVLDTLVMGRLFWPELKEADKSRIKGGKFPKRLLGKYSLEAFGYRMGTWKGEYSDMMKEKGLDPWASWNVDMQEYCDTDCVVTLALYKRCMDRWYDLDEPNEAKRVPHSDRSVHLEHDVAKIIARQVAWGFAFDVKAAEQFYVKLIAEREVLGAELKGIFGSWLAADGKTKTNKIDRQVSRKDLPPVGYKKNKKGEDVPIFVKTTYVAGATYTSVKAVEFNPSSNQHIANRLIKLRGWRPMEFTPSGEVKVDETVLADLPWPEAKKLTTYLTVAKRIGQLAEGKQAWLKKERNGRIHGGVATVGAVTRRMTHSNPNVAQTPTAHAPYGMECRSLFTSTAGFVLVGCDADSLEARCLAGYMARYDLGAYVETLLKGDKSNGTDIHSQNARGLGLDPSKSYRIGANDIGGRDVAKTWFYAFLYGAGDWKLGVNLGATGSDAQIKAVGKAAKESFLRAFPALADLIKDIKKRAFGYFKQVKHPDGSVGRIKVPGRGYLIALDGGKIAVRHEHASLNTLLQSAGAIIMKVALVIADADLQLAGLSPCRDYEFCANIHDEWQLDVLPQHVDLVKDILQEAIRKAGEELNFKCPLAGNADSGPNWAATH